jgi:hypothetical protein
MPIATETGLTTERIQQIAELVKRAGEEAVSLRIVERFLSEVERRLLKTSPVVFDIERVRTALQILKTINEDDDIEECLEAEFRLDQEFHLWRSLIIERDRTIETYHFRRLCDSGGKVFDDEVYVALGSFYRSLEFSPASQSKFDLAVTRLFSRTDERDHREMREPRFETVDRLRRLFGGSDFRREASDVDDAVAAVDGFTSEANHLGNFEDLVRSNIFDRYRIFKRELGSLFFEPEIVAAAIECNIAIGNVFNARLRAADEQLSSRLTVDIDLPSVLHDAAPEARTHISELFKVFFGETDDQHAGADDIDYLGKLLSASVATHTPSVSEPEKPKGFVAKSPVQERLAPVLRTLTEAKPDVELLTLQMQRLETLTNVNINDFLFNSHGSPDILCRRTLGLVIWTLEFRDSELRQKTELTEAAQREAAAIAHKIEDLVASLKNEINSVGEEDKERLRNVLQALVDGRTRLERAILRATNKKPAEPPATVPRSEEEQPQRSTPVKKKRSWLRWLLMIVLLPLLGLAGWLYYFNTDLYSLFTSGSGYGEVNVHEIGASDKILSAYHQDRTLFLNVSDEWTKLSVEERDRSLQAILADPHASKYDAVVALDKTGKMAGISSRDGQRPAKDPTIPGGQ